MTETWTLTEILIHFTFHVSRISINFVPSVHPLNSSYTKRFFVLVYKFTAGVQLKQTI